MMFLCCRCLKICRQSSVKECIRKTVRRQSSCPAIESETKQKNIKAPRRNAVGIQMLSESLHSQIFGENILVENTSQAEQVQQCINHLKDHNLWGKESEIIPDVDLKIPQLRGQDLDQHFRVIANEQTEKYRKLLNNLAQNELQPLPKKWNFQKGWTKYFANGKTEAVDFPDDKALIFDVEVCLKDGQAPTLAVAASPGSWYSWCSNRLTEEKFKWSNKMITDDLIPMETKLKQIKTSDGVGKEKIIVGHNVSFDRACIKEQYNLKESKTRFLDTMSMHIAVSGMTSFQRSLKSTEGTNSQRKDVKQAKSKLSGPIFKDWMHVSSLNNLADVHQLYCDGKRIDKEARNLFVTGTISHIRANFQDLMTYCSSDVTATHEILQALLPMFYERFPHPVTLAGMLEMSVPYLPINQNWQRYLTNAQNTFEDLEHEVKLTLMHLANEACQYFHEEKYKKDPWLCDLDWSTQEIKFKKLKVNKKEEEKNEAITEFDYQEGFPPKYKVEEGDEPIPLSENIKKMYKAAENLYKKRPFMPGYPAWYRELVSKDETDELKWFPGKPLVSVQMRITPRLLRLTWDEFPLHYDKDHGWGYLVSDDYDPSKRQENDENIVAQSINIDHLWDQLEKGIGDPTELSEQFHEALKKKSKWKPKKRPTDSNYSRLVNDVDIPGHKFYRLPHKNGPEHRVGNPLAKDFLSKIEDGTLKAQSDAQADFVLKRNKMTSYWRNAQKRILEQIAVWLRKSELTRVVTRNSDYQEENLYGAILPKIVTAGTLTRRAVEPTWLTASNAYTDRVGSELKSMIQAPPGYRFVGADVDSQELWIAAILGDAHYAGIHGCTAFGWMTLQGKKSDGTDMHSRTASTIGISRDHAKVMNYGRIYGAGQTFAQQLLMQFNHRLSPEEAKSKAQAMFAATKGVRGFQLNEIGVELYAMWKNIDKSKVNDEDILLTKGEIFKLLMETFSPLQFNDIVSRSVWLGGTESAMFNQLEKIAQSPEPKTPVLECRISRSLEPSYVGTNFMTSRVNWVVQSSAVDYLHLMLVNMRWLCDLYQIDARFSISIHDEVRYLVKDEDKYRAALALQVTNLLTRAMFAYKLGMNDLPQSVAFFSAVDIDTVLRKEVTMDCKTPSNPHGLHKGYGIPPGEALDIYTILDKTKGSLKQT